MGRLIGKVCIDVGKILVLGGCKLGLFVMSVMCE